MASRFENCVAALVAKGTISDADAQGVLAAFKNHRARGLDDAAAAVEAGAAALRKSAELRAQRAEEILRTAEIVAKAESYQHGFGPGAHAFLLPDKRGVSGVLSAESAIDAYRNAMHAMFFAGIDAYRSKFGGLTRDVPGLVRFLRELYGETTGDTAAQAAAKAWRDTADFGVTEFKRLGGYLPARDDWRLPNPTLDVANTAAGKARLSKYLHDAYDDGRLRLKDWETGEPADPIKAAAIIAEAVESIATGGLSKRAPGQTRAAAKLANQRAHARVFEWTTADAWLDANRQFGRGDAAIWDMLTGHIEGLARDLGLLGTFGPNPSGTVRVLADMALKRGEDRWARAIETSYDWLSGAMTMPAMDWVAYTNRQFGAFATIGKLLSSPISAVGDLWTLTMTQAWNGVPAWRIAKSWIEWVYGLPAGADKRALAVRYGMGAEFAINRAQAVMKEMEAFGGASFLERSADFALKASLANRQAWNARAIFHMEFMGDLADQANRKFDKLKGRTRRAFERVGIDAEDWALIRKHVQDEGGAEFVAPQNMLRGDDAEREAAIKLLGLSAREMDYAQVQGDLRAQIAKAWNTQAGTAAGLVARETMRFKGYAVGIVTTHINRMIFETQGWGGRVGYGLAFGVGMTVLGAFAMAMKDIVNGKDPRDMTDWRNWAAAAAQGGGLGIFGDLIKSGVTRSGKDAVASALGPTFGLLADTLELFGANIGQATYDKNTNFGRDAVTWLRRNAPGTSLWYARRAIDGYLWDYLQTVLDPDYARVFKRVEDRTRRELNQEYWWPPGNFGPARGPNLSRAFGR